MATETKLRQLAQGGCPVYYFYSSERYLVRQAVARAAKLLAEGEDEETTVLDGAAPEIEQLIMAAGTISFFGTRRVVLLPEVDPAAYSDKDLDELCATLASLENAVVVLGSVFEMERNKLKLGKRAQKLIAQCTKVGFAEELAKPKPYELKVMVMDRAKAQDTTLSEGTATALLERCGEDPFLLENEVDKLCALSGYQTVTITGTDGYIYLQKTLPFESGGRFTIAIINRPGGLDLLKITDNCCAYPTRTAHFRVGNLARNSGALDVLLPDGRTVFTDVRFKEVTAFKRISSGAYEFLFAETNQLPAPAYSDIETLDSAFIGANPLPDTAASVYLNVSRGRAYTVYLLQNGQSYNAISPLIVADAIR